MHITISMSNSIETAGHRKTLLENESLLAHIAQANPPCPAELLRFTDMGPRAFVAPAVLFLT